MTSATPKPRAGEHTKGPWMHTELGTVVAGKTRYIVCEHAGLEDARRIVACVNACEGIPSDILEVQNPGGALHGMTKKLQAERDLLRERERELVEALRALTELCDNVPIFQLDDGNASVKAVRLAGKFTAAHKAAHTLLAKEKTA